MPSSPSSMTPSGSPIAPIAVVSSPGIVSTCTPVVSRRSTTARICSSLAPGVMTTIMGADPTGVARGTSARAADADVARGDVHGARLVAHRDDRRGPHGVAAGEEPARGPGDLDAHRLAAAGGDLEAAL